MQIIELDLSHSNFFCPVTGIQLFSEDSQSSSPALMAVWVQEVANEPDIYNSALEQKWEDWVAANEEEEDFCWDVSEFLATVNEPNWVAFQITIGGSMMPETATILIDMDYEIAAN